MLLRGCKLTGIQRYNQIAKLEAVRMDDRSVRGEFGKTDKGNDTE